MLRWLLWLTVGALLLRRVDTLLTTWATVMWLFVTFAVVWRRLARTNE